MPNYSYRCVDCGRIEVQHGSFATGPVPSSPCRCGGRLAHDFRADALTQEINTAACRDHDFIPEKSRVASNDGFGIGKNAAAKKTARYGKAIAERRKQLRDGGNQGKFKHTRSIPAELFHGKIRETGDRQYWDDKTNLNRHNDWKVS